MISMIFSEERIKCSHCMSCLQREHLIISYPPLDIVPLINEIKQLDINQILISPKARTCTPATICWPRYVPHLSPTSLLCFLAPAPTFIPCLTLSLFGQTTIYHPKSPTQHHSTIIGDAKNEYRNSID